MTIHLNHFFILIMKRKLIRANFKINKFFSILNKDNKQSFNSQWIINIIKSKSKIKNINSKNTMMRIKKMINLNFHYKNNFLMKNQTLTILWVKKNNYKKIWKEIIKNIKNSSSDYLEMVVSKDYELLISWKDYVEVYERIK